MKKFVNVRALAFDFDGTLVESLDIKTQAFRELFKDQPRIAKQFVRFHLEHQGISRVEKIKYAYRELLKKPLSAKQLKAHCNEFSDYVLRAVIRCPFVPGALPFLKKMKQKKIPLFLLSATPDRELKFILKKRGLTHFFKKIHGYPMTKEAALKKILKAEKLKACELIYSGDAPSDYQAAQSAGVPFLCRKVGKSFQAKMNRQVIGGADWRSLQKRIHFATR